MLRKIEELEDGPIKCTLSGWRKYIKGVYMGHSVIVVEWRSKRRAYCADLERLLIAMGFNVIVHNHKGKWLDELHDPLVIRWETRVPV